MYSDRILLTGTTGMLGASFLSYFKDKYDTVITLNRADCDLLNVAFVSQFLATARPDIIIHCAADTNLRRCENHPEQTLLLHCGLTHALSAYPAKFVYISSDSVKDPRNFYAKTKLLGEEIACLNNPQSVILRTNIYGFNSSSGASLAEWALKSFTAGEKITGYTDVEFNAIYTKQLVEVTYKIVNSAYVGHLDVGGNYAISKYEFLQRLCDKFGYDTSLVLSGQLPPPVGGVGRAKSTLLEIEPLKEHFDVVLSLETGLAMFKEEKNLYDKANKHK